MRRIGSNTRFCRRDFIKITAMAGSVLVGSKLLIDLIKDEFATVEETRLLMGTIINLTVMAESRAAGEAAVAATFAELERQIAIFNHRMAHSPVAQLNKGSKLVKPPRELVEVLEMAQSISDLTNGAFDVTVKPLVDLYQTAQPGLPTEKAIRTALARVDYRKLYVSSETVSLAEPGMAITLDGIAKGYIVDAGVAYLRMLGYENVFLEAGGDLMASGMKEDGSSWHIGVQSPRQTCNGLLAIFGVKDQAVATSGDYLQHFSRDMRHHHILDPRSGCSAPYLASATVFAPSCAQADALATALMVMNPEDGLAMMDNNEYIDALLIGKDLEEHRSSGLKDM